MRRLLCDNDAMSPRFRRIVTLVVLFGFIAMSALATLVG